MSGEWGGAKLGDKFGISEISAMDIEQLRNKSASLLMAKRNELIRENREQAKLLDECRSKLQILDSRSKTIQENMSRFAFGKKGIKTKAFNAKYYIKSNPDVVESGVDPVVHYVFHGYFEGRAGVAKKSPKF